MRRFKDDPERELDQYISMVIDNVTLDSGLTTEQKVRELTVFSLTLLSYKLRAELKGGKTMNANNNR